MNPTPQKTVLLADDDASILTVLTRAMKAQGYAVKASENITDIDAWVAQGLGDVVVTDVQMPGRMDGLDLVRIIRRDYPHTRALVTSGRASPQEARLSGAMSFISKPYTATAIQDAVRYALARTN